MKVLVTGGAGFIGYHTVRELLKQGHEVIVFDNFSTGSMQNLTDLSNEFPNGDLYYQHGCIHTNQLDLLDSMLGCQAVIHLAAVVSVVDSIENPMKSFKTNVFGFMNVLEVARDIGIKKVVYASSAAVYGNTHTDEPGVTWKAPTSPYGADKLANDIYANVFKDLYGMEPIGFRYFNVYGPRQDPKSQYAGVISKFLDWVKKGESFTIFGDGEQVRSFVYVEDVAKMNVMAATTNEIHPGVYNLAATTADEDDDRSQSVSINQLVDTLEKIAYRPINRQHHAARVGEIKYSVAELGALNTIRNLPEFTSLKDGLNKTLDSLPD